MNKDALAKAWDSGFNTAASCYWHKPRNPYSGEMNDDIDNYCPEHGGTAKPEHCEDNSHPVEPLPDCTCAVADVGWGRHGQKCPRYTPPLSLPNFTVSRGGITY